MPQTGPSFDAVLLAGGRSSRMGRDKAFLDWEGQPLYVRQLRKLAALGPERLWLSTHAGQSFPAVMEGVVRLVDQQPDLGPLGGLREALAASRAERVLVLAVDLPRMETAFLHRLLAAEGGAVPKTANGWEPLAAVYPRRDTLALVEDALSRGDLRLQHLVDRLESDGLVAAVPVGEHASGLFANVNTPEELATLERGICDEAAPLVRHRIGEPPATVIDRVAREEP
ncbi:MAG TPA: molybdenum cofactor guanylyltransferase, partial [Bacteroidia bacterium]|nr:molybdenum cofactor guanylyltransferase [Bacteroidia bacterium]